METIAIVCLYAAGFAAAAGGTALASPASQTTRWALCAVWPATGIVVLAVLIATAIGVTLDRRA